MKIIVLVVDHDGDLLEEVKHFVRSKGLTIQIISSKTMFDAIRRIEEEKVDAILSDFKIGGKDNNAIDFLEWVKENNRDLPFIIFTDKVNKDIAIKALNLHADYFIKKEEDNYESILSDLFYYIQDIVSNKKAREAIHAAEKRFREVLENSRDAMYKYDFATSQYEYISPSLIHVMGYTPEQLNEMGLSGRKRCNHPDEIDMLSEHREKLKHSAPNSSFRLEYRFRDPKGVYRWISDNHVVLRDEGSEHNFVIGSLRDITERKTKERLLVLQGNLIQKLTTISSVDDAIRMSIEYVKKATDFDLVMCHLLTEDSQQFILNYSIGASEETIKAYQTWNKPIEDLSKTGIETNYILNPIAINNSIFSNYSQLYIVPMYYESQISGFVTLGSKNRISVPEYLTTWLENNINLLANIIVQVKRYQKLAESE